MSVAKDIQTLLIKTQPTLVAVAVEVELRTLMVRRLCAEEEEGMGLVLAAAAEAAASL